MIEKFKFALKSLAPITDAIWKELEPEIYIKSYSKGELLLKAGQIGKNLYFLCSGFVMIYYLKDGEEIVYNFMFENNFAVDYSSFVTQEPSLQNIKAMEDVSVISFSRERCLEYAKEYHVFEKLLRIASENAYVHSRNKTTSFLYDSPEERYKKLVKSRPKVIQSVPQYYIASYLGIKPESLSRIRKRISSQS